MQRLLDPHHHLWLTHPSHIPKQLAANSWSTIVANVDEARLIISSRHS